MLIPLERQNNTGAGGDCDSTRSDDADHADFRGGLFELNGGIIFVAFTEEPNRLHVQTIMKKYLEPDRRVSVGVLLPTSSDIETLEEDRARVLERVDIGPLAAPGARGN